LRKFAALPHGPHARKPRAVGILVFLPQSGNQGSKWAGPTGEIRKGLAGAMQGGNDGAAEFAALTQGRLLR